MFERFVKYIGKNFGNPNGIGGKLSVKIMNIINQKQYNAVLQNMELEPNDYVLDIGFGNGYLIKKIIGKNIPVTIYGIEISNDMFQKVSMKNRQSIQNGILHLSLENINKTSFEDNLFDTIYTVNTIYFWNEPGKCFSEIKRILQPAGIFMNVIYAKEHLETISFTKYGFNKYTVGEIQNITEKHGLKIIETIEIQKNKSYCIISRNEK